MTNLRRRLDRLERTASPGRKVFGSLDDFYAAIMDGAGPDPLAPFYPAIQSAAGGLMPSAEFAP
ncbi:hypothetical protein [Sphingobium yanoikuyae]|uniref:hypothetical protein n=1 Tax=Sphingobium yanoikuyae TaxID=13690 RepID=UPI0028A96632|nr:hypothetical protein [Sphingobium yanoikuyae]